MTIRLNLGCGDQRLDGMIGVDCLVRKGTEVLCDLDKPLPFASEVVDFVYAKSILEHIKEFETLLGEIHQVLKNGGVLDIYVPHWRNPDYYSDYSHKRFFGLSSFDYFSSPGDQVFRTVPIYSSIQFKTLKARLLFKSPFWGFHQIMKGFQWVVNRRKWGQMFYEYHLSGLIPCYALEFKLKKTITG